MSPVMTTEYLGNPDTVADEIRSGSFTYSGLRVFFHGQQAFDLRGDHVADFETVRAVASKLGYAPNFSLGFTTFWSALRASIPKETRDKDRKKRLRALNEVEKTYYQALFILLTTPPGEHCWINQTRVERLEFSGEAPAFSVRTKSSGGGSYTAREVLYKIGVTPPLYPGDGVSFGYNGDLYPATVIRVSPSGKTVTTQRDRYHVISGSAADGSARYDFLPDPDGAVQVVRIRKDGRYYSPELGSFSMALHRKAHTNPHF